MSRSVTHHRQSHHSSLLGAATSPPFQDPCGPHRSDLVFEDVKEDHIFRVDSSNFECGSFASRCSLKLINDVVSKMDKKKRELVISTGFAGLLEFPRMKQINRKFALWLMSCVDESTRTLVVGDHIRIRFCKEDVGNVFGIPCSGKRVIDSGSCSRSAKNKVLDYYMGANFRKHRSIKDLVEVLERVYEEPMTKFDSDRFRIAFVVFVVSTLLSPAAKYDYACIDYWGAIENPDIIADFDWSEFVIIRLLEAVSKLKQDVSSSVRFPNISGCSVFIQVLYLDSLDLGVLSIAEKSLPRIRHFCYDQLRSMIGADNNFLKYVNCNSEANVTKLRRGVDCCYYWSFEVLRSFDSSRSVCLLAIWETCVAMARFLEIPMEAAGPLFVAAADFQDQVDAGAARSGVHAIKYISVLLSIMSAYKEGFSYQFSTFDDSSKGGKSDSMDPISRAISGGLMFLSEPVCRKRKQPCGDFSGSSSGGVSDFRVGLSPPSEGSSGNVSSILFHNNSIGDEVHSSIKSAIESVKSMRPELNVNHRLLGSMSKFYSLVRCLNLPVDFDMNHSITEHYSCEAGPYVSSSQLTREAPSPWSLGYSWSLSEVNSSELLHRISRVRDEDGFVIVHRNPRHIQVTARSFRCQILGNSELELDLFDAIIRKVKQEDCDLYEHVSRVRWRHYFESDFMATLTSGMFDLSDAKILHHFSLCNISFDLRACKLLFFPALLHYRWVCYAWSLESNVIHVFDPSYSVSAPESSIQCHERICYLLKTVMHSVCRGLFRNWNFEWTLAELRMVTWLDKSLKGWNRSGVLSALFCRCFNGKDLTPVPSSVDTNDIAAKLTHDIVSLKGNMGQIPAVLV